jgi:DNA replication and repair protein RecF
MQLRWIELRSFRSYPELTFHPDRAVNLLIGDNGAGKTNLLEAVAYAGTLRSFRRAPEDSLVATGDTSAVIRAEIEHRAGENLVELEIPRRGSRKVLVDRKRLPRASDLLGVMRVITFIPEDLEVVKGGPGARRDFLDEVAIQLWPAAYNEQAEYDRTLRHRNAALRATTAEMAALEVWDARLAQAGGRVMARRARVAHGLAAPLSKAHAAIAGQGEATIEFRSGWGGAFDPGVPAGAWAELFSGALAKVRRRDQERGVTSVGPHRDEPELWISGIDTRHQSSQGEQRTVALALRLAAHSAVEAQTGEHPLLLLDDVFSELDASRAAALTTALPPAQTFITAARPEQVPLSGRVWQVGGGTVR